jgi:predicted ATP-grasp superfamily ATP-dependent carboligase
MLVRSEAVAGDDGYEQLTDKAALLRLAAARGIPVPRGFVVQSISDAVAAAERIGFPAVLKPSRSKALLDDQVVSTSVRIARNATDVAAALACVQWFPRIPVIIQEFIPGRGAGVFSLFDRDHAIAWFAHKRVREKPPAGGVSVLCESVQVDSVLRDYADSLLRAAEYRGVAMIEFRIRPDGRPYLMEVNARFWGSLQLAVDCGVDFPWLYWQILHGQTVEPVNQYVVGRRLRWFLGDVDNLLLQLRDANLRTTEKLCVLRQFVASTCDLRSHPEVFRWSDPLPAMREIRHWVTDVIGWRQ